jgi:dihydrofolate synthase / folylpolyglutamate synthase
MTSHGRQSEYGETIAWLFGLQKFGIKLGLANITSLLSEQGDPHKRYPSIHIAGTNGKGSTAAFIASILRETGLNTGLYTSPHLADFSERIRVDGEAIAEADMVRIAAELRPGVEERNSTFFEATTALAFRYFAERNTDVAVIETGMGGRLDSTNVLVPLASVITNVDFDHMEYLGSTIERIAWEKAGIIKPGVPVITGVAQDETFAAISEEAKKMEAPLIRVKADEASFEIFDIDRMELDLELAGRIERFVSPMIGRAQAMNAALAIRTVALIGEISGKRTSTGHLKRGIANVRTNSRLRCRLERLEEDPELVADAAHNPAGIRELCAAWNSIRKPEKTRLVFGMLKTKDLHASLAELAGYPWAGITMVAPDTPEAVSPVELTSAAREAGLPARSAASVRDGVEQALAASAPGESVLVFGSHYAVGAWLAVKKTRSDGFSS